MSTSGAGAPASSSMTRLEVHAMLAQLAGAGRMLATGPGVISGLPDVWRSLMKTPGGRSPARPPWSQQLLSWSGPASVSRCTWSLTRDRKCRAWGTHLSQGGLQLLKVSWEVCFCRQVLYGQEGGQRLDQVSCQVNVIRPQGDLRDTADAHSTAFPRRRVPTSNNPNTEANTQLLWYLSGGGHADGQESSTSEGREGDVGAVHALRQQEVLLQPHDHLQTDTEVTAGAPEEREGREGGAGAEELPAAVAR